jgi:hypothetical protein
MRIKVNLKDTTSTLWCEFHNEEVTFENANRLKGPLDLSLSSCDYWDTEEGQRAYAQLAATGTVTCAHQQEIEACRASWVLIVEDKQIVRRTRPAERT